MSIVGTAEHYAQFVKLARSRIDQLGITYETVDKVCGFPERYTAALMTGSKSMSVYSFFTLAGALALDVCFHHDEQDLARLRQRSQWIRRRAPKKNKGKISGAVRFHNDTDFYRKIGLLGALAANANAARRKAISEARRKAALARWSNHNGKQVSIRAGLGAGNGADAGG